MKTNNAIRLACGTVLLAVSTVLPAIPADKNLDPAWVQSLTDKGTPHVYSGDELNHIGMPCGGIGAGELYVRGDGALARWWLFNNGTSTADHSTDYTNEITKPIISSIGQGFSLTVGSTTIRLDQSGYDAIQFVGEYPIARVRYLTTAQPQPPLDVSLEVYSPFIPLNARESALPATVMNFSLVNSSSSAVTATLTGWLRDSRVQLSLLRADGSLKVSSSNDVDTVLSIAPGEARDAVFLVTWHFVSGDRFMYNNWFSDANDVAQYVADNYARLSAQTHRFHDAYYTETTLPYWFVQRIAMPVSTLASETSIWKTNGRFWAWEGVHLGYGTCTHVYNYAQAMSRLFPELERSVRTMQDLAPGILLDNGMVGFRGESDFNYFGGYAADGQCGTVLKCYREHLMSTDSSFLRDNWANIKKVMDYMVVQDQNGDGILTGSQPQTFDCDYGGPNTFVGALYLAALRAAEEMARTMGDNASADSYHAIFESGRTWTEQNLFNDLGYFFHLPQGGGCSYGNECLADQVFGQNWAHQVGLGYLYAPDMVKSALSSVYKYNWAPDAADGPLNEYGRKYAVPGEAGLFNKIYVTGMGGNQLFQNEIWTGVEYQVGSGMIEEGLLTEGLAIIRGVHDRYSATKRRTLRSCNGLVGRAPCHHGIRLRRARGGVRLRTQASPGGFQVLLLRRRGMGHHCPEQIGRYPGGDHRGGLRHAAAQQARVRSASRNGEHRVRGRGQRNPGTIEQRIQRRPQRCGPCRDAGSADRGYPHGRYQHRRRDHNTESSRRCGRQTLCRSGEYGQAVDRL
jgi:uncharacterized protein (DUF608 family)